MEIGDGEGLRDAIIAMVDDPEGCASMGTRAKKLYEEQYSYEAAMEKYGAVMREMI